MLRLGEHGGGGGVYKGDHELRILPSSQGIQDPMFTTECKLLPGID